MEFRKKKQKKVEPTGFSNAEAGDAYCYLDLKRTTGLFVAFSVGKWIQTVSDNLYEQIAERSQQPDYKHKISFCTDGNDQNENAILKYFNKDCVHYGKVIKIREKQKVIGIQKETVFGNIWNNAISIAHIDGFCSKLRARIGCFVRKTRNFAKKRKQINSVLHITQTNHNFVEADCGITPAMKEHLTKKIWSWNDVFNARISLKI